MFAVRWLPASLEQRFRPSLLAMAVVFATAPAIAADAALELEFNRSEPLPGFDVDAQPARIHTQGLFATPRHYYVTGRLETAPKRPLLIRFQRDDLKQTEVLDLATAIDPPNAGERLLDHPGGFDSDGESFWIPVAVSRP